ncbi:hypothetical protein AMTR_s00060p00071170 [Amborella trichopoda]|uniref:Polysaccharide biosynthesis protein C-terminal domain-containing protein n=1 Tax=Amborella trichopoda TaxID=13333 RepID=W1NJY2_AMBTC|nr:hypothetical protein AMTR_s00060p00071170 [Amborella trichopoda]
MMIALGFLASASVRVANELGAGNARGAKFATLVVTLTSMSLGCVLWVLFIVFRKQMAYIFTNDEQVREAVINLSILLAFSVRLNSVQPVLSGVAIGAGWQSKVAYVNITCYYVIGIPLGLVLGYVLERGVKGIWIGMLCGTGAQTMVLAFMTYRTDWNKQQAWWRLKMSEKVGAMKEMLDSTGLGVAREKASIMEGEVAGGQCIHCLKVISWAND